MNKPPFVPQVSEEDLHAFVDSALDPERRREVQDYLDRNPDAAAMTASFTRQRQMLRSELAYIADEPVPERLRMANLMARQQPSSTWLWRMAAAVMLSVSAGALGGWQMHGAFGQAPAGVMALAGEARTSYAAYAAEPVEGVGKAELVSLVSSKLKRDVAVPDLSQAGYHYAGGRLVATEHGPAGLFFFDSANGTRLAVMVREMAADQEAPMMEQSTGKIGGFTWAQRGLGYSVVGTEATELLHPLANEVRRQTRASQAT